MSDYRARTKRERHGRIEGRRGVELRKRRLANEPLCRMCKAKGVATPATTPDHIKPLAHGGLDIDDNIQCLCAECHADKTAYEGHNSQAAANHPDWLKPSAIPLTIISGPPCSGKTTYVNDHAAPNDLIIDLDGILQRLNPAYKHWSGGLDQSLFNKAIRIRNSLLGSLCQRSRGRAWFIVSAPAPAERRWWKERLGGEVVLLHPGAAECKRRADHRGTPNAKDGVDAWEKASRSPWVKPEAKPAKQRIGTDGWPID